MNKAIREYNVLKTEEFQSALADYRAAADAAHEGRPEDFSTLVEPRTHPVGLLADLVLSKDIAGNARSGTQAAGCYA